MVKMANDDKIAQTKEDSEMEEGEIVDDDLDELSDISSEEEFLLRQRLEVLEDYNNALERTKNKRSSGIKPVHNLLHDLSEISAAKIDEKKYNSYKPVKGIRNAKYRGKYSKPMRKKEQIRKNVVEAYAKRKRDYRKKSSNSRKKLNVKVVSESSDESDDEYRNKRKKLSDAVVGHRDKSDTSSLSARLKKMLHKHEDIPIEANDLSMYQNNNNQNLVLDSIDEIDCGKLKNVKETTKETEICESIELLSSDDDDVKVVAITKKQPTNLQNDEPSQTMLESKVHKSVEADTDSDEDLAQLRQQVLSTKSMKAKPQAEPEVKIPSDDEDSDTTELRLICLKSTLLKRAIEMKQKQKLQKRLSQTTLEEDLFFSSKIDSANNTDIESMDMDIGSDADEKTKDNKDESVRLKKIDDRLNDNNCTSAITSVTNKDEELEEDEDLLRAKLLTSLSKNLPNLVSPELLNTINEMKNTNTSETVVKNVKLPEKKRFIIKLGESDSEGEHEATKNLKKMHMKLSEQSDFQRQLDLFLKSTRMQVENAKLPDVVQKPVTPKKSEKFVAKAVNHLPKSEQLEYKNLVRRMAELEKMKQLRQASLNCTRPPLKDTLKPRNASIDPNLDERISISRKKIADESAKMLKLKEEATKLSQKYKIVSNELHNISTAITLNKKQQRAVQNCLSKIRQQHQSLIKSSSTSLHSKVNGHCNNNITNKVTCATKLQKENNPKDGYKNPMAQKTVKISVVNNLNKNEKNTTNHKSSVEVNVSSNKKVVKMPSPVKDRVVEITKTPEKELKDNNIAESLNPLPKENVDVMSVSKDNTKKVIDNEQNIQRYFANDYKSPLDAFGETSWKSDPNAILCPFEVGGQCKDSDCKYLHTQLSEQ